VYYELYIDQIFLENLLFNFFLLLLTAVAGKLPVRLGRIFLGALTGSLAGCLFVVLHLTDGILNFAGQLGISIVMIRCGFAIGERKRFRKALLIFYGLAFLFGGILDTVYVRLTLPVLFSSMISVLLLYGMLKLMERWKNETQNIWKVTLVWNGMRKELYGFRDTGNRLLDPYYGKPVTVVEYQAVKEFFNRKTRVLWIPYHTVGKASGCMPGIQVDYFLLHQENGEKRIEHPIVAISKETISGNGTYQMILPSTLTDD